MQNVFGKKCQHLAATSTGYVVYRCQTLDGCIVTDPGNQSGPGNAHGAFVFDANYVMVDGFSLQSSPAQQTYGSGFTVQNGTNHFTFTHHHLWVLNSIASGYGQSGAQMNEGEYFYLVHNQMTNNSANNSSCDNGAQGSGISIFQPIALSGYTPTADDLSNSVVGSVGNNFHQFVMWNVLNNNYIYPCGSDSDGDGFIADTWSWINVSGGSHYTGGGLVAFNVAYNNGGAGFYATNSEYVTFANNTAYNDFLDTSNNGTSRGEFDQNCCSSSANTYINNIGYGIVGSGVLTNNTSLVISTGDIIYNFDTYNNNISYCSGSPANGCPYIPQQHDFMVDAAFYAGATTGDSVTITTTGTAVPAPLNAGTTYYIAKYGQLGSTLGSIYFATTYANATSGNTNNYIGLYQPGNGTFTVHDLTNSSVSTIARAAINTFACSGTNGNLCGSNPTWINVGNTSAGSETVPPNGVNFVPNTGSPAIGAGQTPSYLPTQASDLGACYHTLSSCP